MHHYVISVFSIRWVEVLFCTITMHRDWRTCRGY